MASVAGLALIRRAFEMTGVRFLGVRMFCVAARRPGRVLFALTTAAEIRPGGRRGLN
jgi:hypothetical protein